MPGHAAARARDGDASARSAPAWRRESRSPRARPTPSGAYSSRSRRRTPALPGDHGQHHADREQHAQPGVRGPARSRRRRPRRRSPSRARSRACRSRAYPGRVLADRIGAARARVTSRGRSRCWPVTEEGSFKTVGYRLKLGSDDDSSRSARPRKTGGWYVEVRFQDPSQVVHEDQPGQKVSVPAAHPRPASTPARLKVKSGRLTINGQARAQPPDRPARRPGARRSTSARSAGRRRRAGGRRRHRGYVIATVKAQGRCHEVHGALASSSADSVGSLELKYAAGGLAGTGYAGLRTVRAPEAMRRALVGCGSRPRSRSRPRLSRRPSGRIRAPV